MADSFNEADTHCNTCSRLLDRVGDLLSLNCGGDCVKCMVEGGDPESKAYVNGLQMPEDVAASTRHGMSREQVEDLWEHIVQRDAKLQDGVWVRPAMPEWIQLLYLSARR